VKTKPEICHVAGQVGCSGAGLEKDILLALLTNDLHEAALFLTNSKLFEFCSQNIGLRKITITGSGFPFQNTT